jgi:Adenosine-deaminase (editase) domain
MGCAGQFTSFLTFQQYVFNAYNQLGKHGKPSGGQHTVLAAVVLEHKASAAPHLVSLATGTKCLSAQGRDPQGRLVHDCHAEVLARRAALHWVYNQLECTLQQADKGLHLSCGQCRMTTTLGPKSFDVQCHALIEVGLSQPYNLWRQITWMSAPFEVSEGFVCRQWHCSCVHAAARW